MILQKEQINQWDESWCWVRDKGRRCEVDQKDHLSCVRGSVDWEGFSEGDWLLLSSPFKLFLQTGHVSCISNQGTIHSEWKKWLQGSCLTGSPTAKSSLHTGHSIQQSACSWVMLTVGRDEIFSFSAGGGPVFSNWPSNCVITASKPPCPHA